ncbi:MAG: putative bifunctional diguanylate cyclase/phosphodiesterase [Acidimicrobiales bacterium]
MRFAFAGMVLLLGLGAGAEALARHEASRNAQEQVAREAELIGALVEPVLTDGSGVVDLRGPELVQMQQAALHLDERGSVKRLRLWSTQGVLLVDVLASATTSAATTSNADPDAVASQVTAPSMDDPAFGHAAAGRPTMAGIGSAVIGSDGGGSSLVMLQPLRSADGAVVGVAEIEIVPSHEVWEAGRKRLRVVLMSAVVVIWVVLAAAALRFTRTMRRNAEELRHQANFDPLTGLPNLRNFTEHGNELVAGLGAAGEPVTVVLFDLVGFTQINSTVGRIHGDRLLRGVAERLQAAVDANTSGARASGREQLVARVGGDVFAMLLPGVNATAALDQLDPFRNAIATDVEVEGIPISFETAIGVASFPLHGADIGVLLQRADLAMEHAKSSRADVKVYDPATDRTDGRRLGLAVELRRAIASNELFLHYQPKVHLADGTVSGVEALVRWQHPQRGLISPGEFIPVAETTGLIVPLTAWVLDRAIDQATEWAAAGLPLPVAVNVSAKSLRDDRFVEQLLRLLARKAVPTNLIEVEITETAIITDPERAARSLRRLHDAGVAVALDDFGQGATSLAYLENMSMSTLKVDKSLVDSVCGGGAGAAIVHSMIGLAHSLGMDVVAEGVEQACQQEMLAAWGCDIAQGFHLARPMSAEGVTAFVASGRVFTAAHNPGQDTPASTGPAGRSAYAAVTGAAAASVAPVPRPER